MKRFVYLLFVAFTFIHCIGQKPVPKYYVFKKTEYVSEDVLFGTQVSNDTIRTYDDSVDIYFCKRHFFLPYHLPRKLIDRNYKDTTISVWRDDKAQDDYSNNWVNTYTYDSLSRVINYTYSGCIICDNMPYNYTVTYNAAGLVSGISNKINEKDSYRYYYNEDGDIRQFDCYSSQTLSTSYTLVK